MKKILLMVGLSVLATATFARGGHGGGHGGGHSHTSSYSSHPSHSTSFSSYSSSKEGSTKSKETSYVRSSHGGSGSNDCDKKDRYGKPINKNCQTM